MSIVYISISKLTEFPKQLLNFIKSFFNKYKDFHFPLSLYMMEYVFRYVCSKLIHDLQRRNEACLALPGFPSLPAEFFNPSPQISHILEHLSIRNLQISAVSLRVEGLVQEASKGKTPSLYNWQMDQTVKCHHMPRRGPSCDLP